eukprot:653537-Rhodomonas_salina.6
MADVGWCCWMMMMMTMTDDNDDDLLLLAATTTCYYLSATCLRACYASPVLTACMALPGTSGSSSRVRCGRASSRAGGTPPEI